MKQSLALLLFLFFKTLCFGQIEWVNFTSAETINDIWIGNSQIIYGTNGGLVLEDLIDDDLSYINRGNSEIPSNLVLEVEVDNDGVIWIMTDKGLSSFNNTWTHYQAVEGKILAIDSDGIIVASSQGLHIWDNGMFVFEQYPQFQPILEVGDPVYTRHDSSVWITLENNSKIVVLKYSNGEWELFDSTNSNLPPKVNLPILLPREDSTVWLVPRGGRNDSMYVFDGTWETFERPITIGFLDVIMTSILEDQQLYFLVRNPTGTSAYLVKYIKNGGQETIPIPPSEESNSLPTVSKGGNGMLFFGFQDIGVHTYENENWVKRTTTKTPFLSNEIWVNGSKDHILLQAGWHSHEYSDQVIQYSEGVLSDESMNPPFVLGLGTPIALYDYGPNGQFLYASHKLFKDKDGVWSPLVLPDIVNGQDESSSHIYYGDYGGTWLLPSFGRTISYNDGNRWRSFDPVQTGLQSSVYFSFLDNTQREEFWFTSFSTLHTYDYKTSKWSRFRNTDLNLSTSPLSLARYKDEVYGISFGLLFRFDGVNVDSIALAPDMVDGVNSFSMIASTTDYLWIGFDGGVLRYDGSSFELFDHTNSGIPNGYIMSMHKDIKGNFWFGSQTGGLAVYNPDGVSDDILNSSSTSVSNKAFLKKIDVFPNPLDDFITIPDFETNMIGRIISADGRFVMSISSSKPNLGELRSGVYSILWLMEGDIVGQSRIVKK